MTVTFSIDSTPTGASFNTSTGALTGNPSTAGTHSFNVTADNGYQQDTRNFNLIVSGVTFSITGGIAFSGGITINT